MATLIAVGACYLDTILTVEYYPAEDEKLRASQLEKRRGGNVPNTLEVLQQVLRWKSISAPLILLAVLPNRSSPATEEIRASLGPHVDFAHCFYRKTSSVAPSSYIFKSLATDSRTLVNYSDLEEMNTSEFEQAISKFANQPDSIYHFEGRIPDVTAECIDCIRIRDPKATISVEVEKPNREGLQRLAQKADVVFYSKSWAQAQGYQSATDCLQRQTILTPKASFLFCTWGVGGAAALRASDKSIVQVPAYLPHSGHVVDTIGAGDTFIAGVLFGLFYTQNQNMVKTLSFANELAGRKVAQHGFSGLAEKMGQF
ncbi:hypothetical protein EPUS_01532 [Endocarpon pusillum Z07020]|uniref:Carbohydrate kinase PfkB domain-containing protein n=1 Tax=Endocarpon pusillum (strain Z07020 / HMAS-L-300199) TaxID=1263415 RepID=U1GDN4_ENDPU|nr:uncharacterized protein EPUS_01532 [Endocarpon pusillum Z07020]ERF75702.1 hypothetical protein EPUS_01532 [Endocarpon pusillum Z07020]